jgi:mannosyltransferase OCH1-like enzyme
MKKILFIALALIATVVGISYIRHTPVPVVDFDFSMQKDKYLAVIDPQWGEWVYKTLRSLYEKNCPDKVKYHEQVLIPRKIHQIWLGSALPEEYKILGETFKEKMPEWEYKLWTDATLQNYPMHNRQLYDAAINYGEKADIARYEILYNEGGVYVDTDYECIKSLEPFNHYYDFYIGIQPLDTNFVQLGIGLIGAAPQHPIIKVVIDRLLEQSLKTNQVIMKTGPVYFTYIFCQVAPTLQNPVIALPATYLYPRGYTQTLHDRATWLRPESYAVHHWAGSWLKKEAFQPSPIRAIADTVTKN